MALSESGSNSAAGAVPISGMAGKAWKAAPKKGAAAKGKKTPFYVKPSSSRNAANASKPK